MSDAQREISRTRFRIGWILGLRTAIAVLSGWLLAWGTIVLILRGTLETARGPLLWGFAGFLVAIVAGIVVARRRTPSESSIRALLDQHYGYGGLLMAAEETSTERWPIRRSESTPPSIRWDGRRQWGILLFSSAFVIMTFLVPSRFFGEIGTRRLQVDQEIAKLAEQIDVLKEEKFLPPERAESLEASLDQLKKEATGNDPAKTWEAMDHLEQSIDRAAAEAAEALGQEARKFARAEELASALQQAQDDLPEPSLTEAMKALANELQNAADENSMLSEELSEQLKEMLKNGSLSPEQLSELAKSLGKCKAGDLSKLGKLADLRMIDPSALEKLNGECKIDPEGLAKLLAECKNGNKLSECLGVCLKPGRGGISRGRGDAAMTWQENEASREDTTFKEKVLPPGAAASMKDASLQGLSVGAPSQTEGNSGSAGGALDVGNAGRGSARTQVILPEHKRIVQRYFDRENAGKAAKEKTP